VVWLDKQFSTYQYHGNIVTHQRIGQQYTDVQQRVIEFRACDQCAGQLDGVGQRQQVDGARMAAGNVSMG